MLVNLRSTLSVAVGGSSPGLSLGDFGTEAATLDAIAQAWTARVQAEPYLPEAERIRRVPLQFSAFCDAVQNFDRYERDNRRRDVATVEARHVLGPEPPHVTLFRRQGPHPAYAATVAGYHAYLAQRVPRLDDLVKRAPSGVRLDEGGLADGVLIVAQRGWGKSELLKALIRHEVEKPATAGPASTVIVLDPLGNLGRQVAHWPELAGSPRLKYVEPGLQPGLTVGLNPLDGTGLDHEGRNVAAMMLAAALGANTAALSSPMRTLIIYCATVLLSRPGSSLRDLRTMLRDPSRSPEAAALVQLGAAYPDPDVSDFFAYDFDADAYRTTKEALLSRLNELFAVHHLAGMFGGRRTLDLRQSVQAGDVVVFNLSRLEDEDAISKAGRLIVANVGAAVRARAQNPDAQHLPVQFVVDEMAMVAGSELVRMLAQLRKWGLNLVMAQQVAGTGLSPEDKAVLLGNTGCRFVGGKDRRMIGDLLDLGREAATLPAIERFQFWTLWRGLPGARLLNVRSDLADFRLSVSREEWAACVARLTLPPEAGGIYRPTKEASLAPPQRVAVPALPEAPAAPSDAPPPAAPVPPVKRPRAKAAAVVVTPSPRPSKATKPVAKKAEPPDLKPTDP